MSQTSPKSTRGTRYRTCSDETIVVALARGQNQREAAETAGVSERTVRRRLDDPPFRERVAQARTQLLETAIAKANAQSHTAIDTIIEVLNSQSDANRLRAAQLLLGLSKDFVQTQHLSERINELENRLRTLVDLVEEENSDAAIN